MARRGLKTTTIQYGPGREDSAKTLAAALPGAKLKEVDSLGSRVQVLVGSDWNGAKKVKVQKPAGSDSGTSGSKIETGTATQKLCK